MRIANYLLATLAALLVIGEIMRGWFGPNGYGLLALSLFAPTLTLAAISRKFDIRNTHILAIVANIALIGYLWWLISRVLEGGNIYGIVTILAISIIPVVNLILLLKQQIDTPPEQHEKQKLWQK